jgi:hypothetical protein
MTPLEIGQAACSSAELLALVMLLIKNNQAGDNQVIIDTTKLDDGSPIYIDPNLVKEMVSNYKKNHLAFINSAASPLTALRNPDPASSDSRSAWFSYNRLLRFLLEVKEKSGVTDTSTLGIRFYYAEYPSTAQFAAPPSPQNSLAPALGASNPELLEFAGMHNLVLVPTNKIGTIDTDFAINLGDSAPLTRAINTVYPPGPGVPAGPTTPVLMLDHSSLKPPPYDEALIGTGATLMEYVDAHP